jgi:transposase
MGKRFRDSNLDQKFLLPLSFHDWLPKDHLARWIADVTSQLDLAAFYAKHEEDGRGRAAYDPLMMTRLLLYGYAIGVTSSRRIERATFDDLAFRYLSANQHPRHAALADFRRQNMEDLAKLFLQVLRLCEKVGLVKLGNVAIDGTKILANASTRRSVPYEKIQERVKYWEKVVADLLAAAEQTDAQEDQRYGKGQPADPLPPELADAQKRLDKLREAKAALEREAQQQLEELQRIAPPRGRGRPRKEEGEDRRPKKAKKQLQRARRNAASPSRQHNFVDPDSRVMPDSRHKKSFVQAYNAQAAVDSHAQVIVAAEITQQTNDKQQMIPMIQAVKKNMGRNPQTATMDNGYWDTDSLQDPTLQGIEVLVAPEAQRSPRGEARPDPALNNAEAQRMRAILATEAGQASYRLRKTTVEPVFGQIKEARGIRRLRLRGKDLVSGEWQFICTTHNLRKLHLHHHPKPKPQTRTKRGKETEKQRGGKTAFCSHRRSSRRYPYTLAYSSQQPNRQSGAPATNGFLFRTNSWTGRVVFPRTDNLQVVHPNSRVALRSIDHVSPRNSSAQTRSSSPRSFWIVRQIRRGLTTSYSCR